MNSKDDWIEEAFRRGYKLGRQHSNTMSIFWFIVGVVLYHLLFK